MAIPPDQKKEAEKAFLNELYYLAGDQWERNSKKQNFTKAIALYSKIIAQDPGFGLALEKRAWCYRKLKQFDEAIADYMQVFQRYYTSYRLLRMVAETLLEAKRYPQAVETFTRVLELDASDIFANEGRSKALKALGRNEEAIHDDQIIQSYYDREKAKWDDPNHYYHYK